MFPSVRAVTPTFLPETGEPFYGLGILQHGALSLRGKERRMIQGNTEDFVPVVQSVKGYGIYWDNPSPTVFRDGADGIHGHRDHLRPRGGRDAGGRPAL